MNKKLNLNKIKITLWKNLQINLKIKKKQKLLLKKLLMISQNLLPEPLN